MTQVASAVQKVRTVQIVLMITIPLYGLAGESLAPLVPKELKIILPAILMFDLFIVVGGLILRARMVRAAEEALRLHPDDAQALNRWRAGTLGLLVLTESVALSGVALRIMGSSFWDVVPFYAGAILLMLLWTPRLDVSSSNQT